MCISIGDFLANYIESNLAVKARSSKLGTGIAASGRARPRGLGFEQGDVLSDRSAFALCSHYAMARVMPLLLTMKRWKARPHPSPSPN